MAVQASQVISRVRKLLVDEETSPRWTDAELLGHITDGQRAIASVNPGAASKTAVTPLVAGTKQTLPEDGTQLLTITRNMGVNGLQPGRVLRVVRRDIMDDQNPMWHSVAPSPVAQNYIYDPQNPKTYFVYPPSNGNNQLELIYTYIPEEVTALSSNLALDASYLSALTDYVMFRAHQKDSDFAAGAETSNMYLKVFMTFLQGMEQSEIASNPNLQTTPFNPASKGTAK